MEAMTYGSPSPSRDPISHIRMKSDSDSTLHLRYETYRRVTGPKLRSLQCTLLILAVKLNFLLGSIHLDAKKRRV